MPAPSTPFFVTDGAVPADGPSYVERRADGYLLTRLRVGDLCYVLAPREVGKSSLMLRAAARLRAEGVRVALLDLAALEPGLSEAQWYESLLIQAGWELDLPQELRASWAANEAKPLAERWLTALAEAALAGSTERLVLFLDGIEVAHSLPFPHAPFFAAIRAAYDRRREQPELGRLAFCVLGVADAAELCPDRTRSPFETGRRVELADFQEAEAAGLAAGLGKPERTAKALLRRVLYWTGGHPYLTQRLCEAVVGDASARSTRAVDRACGRLFLAPAAGASDPHLDRMRAELLQEDGRAEARLALLAEVRSRRPVRYEPDDPITRQLLLQGLVRPSGERLLVRNRIYALAFAPHALAAAPGRAAGRPGTRRRLLIAAGIVLLGAVLWPWGGLGPGKPGDQLPDGTRVRLERVSYGRTHRFGPQFQLAHLLPFVPTQPFAEENTRTDALVLFLSHRPASGRGYLPLDWWTGAAAVDEHGCRFKMTNRMQRAGSRGSSSSGGAMDGAGFSLPSVPYDFVLGSGTLHAFPRRGPDFPLQIASGGLEAACEVRVPNPVSGPFPTWTAEAYPIRRQVGDVTLVLDGLRLRHQAEDRSTYGINNAGPTVETLTNWLEPQVTFLQKGKPTDAWAAIPQDVSDATGNVSLNAECQLCPFEPAWKLRLRAFRTETAKFAPGETWVVRNIPLQPRGRVVPLTDQAERQGVQLRLLGSGGPGKTVYTNGIPKAATPSPGEQGMVTGTGFSTSSSSSGNGTSQLELMTGVPHLALETVGLTDDLRLTLTLTDDRGRPVRHSGSGRSDNLWLYPIEPEPGARSVTARITVQREQTVELLVKPPQRWYLQPSLPLGEKGAGALEFSPDGSLLAAVVAGTGEVQLWGTQGRAVQATILAPSAVRDLQFAPDGSVLYTAHRDGVIRVWDGQSGARVRELAGPRSGIRYLRVRADGTQLLTLSEDGRLRVWRTTDGRVETTMPGTFAGATALAWSGDGKRAVVGGRKERAQLVSVPDGRSTPIFKEAAGELTSVVFSPDDRQIAYGCDHGSVHLWDPQANRMIRQMQVQGGDLLRLGYGPGGKSLIAVDEWAVGAVFDPASGQPRAMLTEGNGHEHRAAAVSPNGTAVALGGPRRPIIRRWTVLGK